MKKKIVKKFLGSMTSLILALMVCCNMTFNNRAYAASGLAVGVKKIESGTGHNLILKTDSTVWAWGMNSNAQLGTGNMSNKTSPVQVLTNVKDISAKGSCSAAVKNDGTVWVWGWNSNGQVGDGTTSVKYYPTKASNLTDIKTVKCGYDFTIALKNDGTVWTWGSNAYGQLGDGTKVNKTKPIQVPGLSNIKDIEAGTSYAIALKDDGTIWTWGRNDFGQLGDGTTIDKTQPVQVIGLSDIKKIDGFYSTIALKNDGTVWTWGLNGDGQLGDGTTTDRSQPGQVIGLSNIEDIDSGLICTAAIKNDGTIWMFGNPGKVFGDGTTSQSNIPIQVIGISDIKSIECGNGYCIASKNTGTIWSWGVNSSGQLGNETTTNSSTPIQLSSLNPTITPIQPQNFTATYENNQIILSWDYHSNNNSYSIKRATSADGEFVTIEEDLIDLNYVDTNITSNTNYFYSIRANNNGFLSDPSSASIEFPEQIESPSNLQVALIEGEISLTWNVVADAESYNIYRSTDSGGPYTILADGITDINYIDTTVDNNTTYYYVVNSVKGTTISAFSEEVSIIIETEFHAPTNLLATPGDGNVSLTWNSVSGASSYNISRTTTPGGVYMIIASDVPDTNYTDTTVVNGTTYYYIVNAVNSEEISDNSNEVGATPVEYTDRRILLVITLSSGVEKFFDISEGQLLTFINWIEDSVAGIGNKYFTINLDKNNDLDSKYNKGPLSGREEFIMFDKIDCFEVIKYSVGEE